MSVVVECLDCGGKGYHFIGIALPQKCETCKGKGEMKKEEETDEDK